MRQLFEVWILFPDNSHIMFEAHFTIEEKREYEIALQESPCVKTWCFSKL
jgi:hypothetical protein